MTAPNSNNFDITIDLSGHIRAKCKDCASYKAGISYQNHICMTCA